MFCFDISHFWIELLVFAMAASSGATITVESCVRSYHMYKDIWDATVGEELDCARESNNPADRYICCCEKKDGETVGHVLRKMSRLCTLFLEHKGVILCTYNNCSACNSA